MKTNKVLLVLFTLQACSSSSIKSPLPWEQGDGKGVKITDIRPADANATKVSIRIKLNDYKRALAEGGNLNLARLVEVTNPSSGPQSPPEYRVFDVKKGGVYEVLKLETADIIVSAGGYVIPNQTIFWGYLNLMKDLKSGSLQIRRAGRTFYYNYIFEE